MKKLLPCIILVSLFFTGCQSMMTSTVGFTQRDPKYKIEMKNPMENRAYVRFYGREYLMAEEDRIAVSEMREPKYTAIPKNGYISILLRGHDIESANPKNFLYILHDAGGNEIYRANGGDSFPNYDVSVAGNTVYTVWDNVDFIFLEKNCEFPLSLRIVLSDKTPTDFVISAAVK